MRNNFFYIDMVAELFPRVTLYASYRLNQDGGQGTRRADPAGTPGDSDQLVPDEFPIALRRKSAGGTATAKLSRALALHVVASVFWSQRIA